MPTHLGDRTRLWILLSVVGIFACVCGLELHRDIGHAQGAATVRPEATQQDKVVTISVLVQGVHDLAGFQMVVGWDAARVSLTDVQGTDFLGGSGRRPTCPDATTQDGAFRFACVTFNAPPKEGESANAPQLPGVEGDGTIAQAHFKVVSAGPVTFHLSHVLLVDPAGNPLQSQTVDLDFAVKGTASSSMRVWLMGLGAAVVALVLVVAVLLVGGRHFRRIRKRSSTVKDPV